MGLCRMMLHAATGVVAGLMMKPPTSFGFSSLDWELCTKDNAAVAISFTSFLVSVCIALSGARIDVLGGGDFWVRHAACS